MILLNPRSGIVVAMLSAHAFVIVGAGNAVNFTDGLDGLAIGPVMIAGATFGFIAYATVIILAVMSFGSFFILFTKWFEQSKIMRQGRELLTIKKDCELTDYIPGLPSLEDIKVTDGQDTEGLKAFYEKYGFKGLVKQLETHDVPPELIEEHRSKQRVGPGPQAQQEEPDLTARRYASSAAA